MKKFESLEILIFNQGPCRGWRVSLLEATVFEGIDFFVCLTSNGRSVHSMGKKIYSLHLLAINDIR